LNKIASFILADDPDRVVKLESSVRNRLFAYRNNNDRLISFREKVVIAIQYQSLIKDLFAVAEYFFVVCQTFSFLPGSKRAQTSVVRIYKHDFRGSARRTFAIVSVKLEQ
jgi:hypothetical protein